MISDLIALRNKLQPKSSSNSDTVQFDYKFWTDVERLAKKNRTSSLETLKKTCDDPEKVGVILSGSRFQTNHTISNPIQTFDKEVFMDLLAEQCGISRPTLRELATKAVVDGARRHTFIVEEKG